MSTLPGELCTLKKTMNNQIEVVFSNSSKYNGARVTFDIDKPSLENEEQYVLDDLDPSTENLDVLIMTLYGNDVVTFHKVLNQEDKETLISYIIKLCKRLLLKYKYNKPRGQDGINYYNSVVELKESLERIRCKLLVPSTKQAGGRVKQQKRYSKTDMTVDTKKGKRCVYLGSRGGKYIKDNGKFVPLRNY